MFAVTTYVLVEVSCCR